jgi:ABC-2 type transport system ATP-binding protein
MTPVLVARNLEKRYGQRVAIEDVSFSLHRGEVLALLGPNGAGKTTILRLLAGLLRPTCGTIAIEGVDQTSGGWSSARTALGFLTETPGLWDRLSVEINLLTYARLYRLRQPRQRVTALLGAFGLDDRAAEPAGTLSKGMRQKVALARALIHDPPIVLLDEPTAGLDPAMTRSVRELIERLRAEGRAVVLSTHNLDEAARVATRVGVLKRTLRALDTPQSLRARWTTRRIEIVMVSVAAHLAAVARAAGAEECELVDHRTLRCTVKDADRSTPQLVRALVEAGAEIRAVIPNEATLEDVYLAVTGDHE